MAYPAAARVKDWEPQGQGEGKAHRQEAQSTGAGTHTPSRRITEGWEDQQEPPSPDLYLVTVPYSATIRPNCPPFLAAAAATPPCSPPFAAALPLPRGYSAAYRPSPASTPHPPSLAGRFPAD